MDVGCLEAMKNLVIIALGSGLQQSEKVLNGRHLLRILHHLKFNCGGKHVPKIFFAITTFYQDQTKN
jgi:hypothetical protein